MSRAERLRNYCEKVRGVDAVWGVDDCTQWAANWVERETGIIIPRKPYASKEEALILIGEAGSLADIWREALPELSEINVPEAGDVAVIDTLKFGQIGCIWTRAGMVAWRSERGIHVFGPNPNRVITSWRLP